MRDANTRICFFTRFSFGRRHERSVKFWLNGTFYKIPMACGILPRFFFNEQEFVAVFDQDTNFGNYGIRFFHKTIESLLFRLINV